LAAQIRGTNKIIRETLDVPRNEARKRAKQLFEEFPPARYLTGIVSWRVIWGGTVELRVKRLETPIDDTD
jgi:hypothetical protein